MPVIQISSLEGSSFPAYMALPVGGNGPGLIVAHEIFGLNDSAQRTCDAFAERGYIAVCPDLFWRQSDKGKTALFAESDWSAAASFYKAFDVEAGLRDLLATLAFIRKTPGCNGKVGVLGFCLGSRLAYLLAARSDVDCAVAYYGVGIDSLLDEVHDIRMPFLLHLGEQDRLIPPPVQKRMLSSLERNAIIKVCTYLQADHGFARSDGAQYLPEAAEEAERRTVAFLSEYLQS